jgi:cell division protein FtsN
VIRRADLGDKGTVYRAFVGPFNSRDEATTFCSNLKSAGGQCFVPSN